MKLVKLLALAMPVALLASCGGGEEKKVDKVESLDSAKILAVTGVKAEKVEKYQVSADSKVKEKIVADKSYAKKTTNNEKFEVYFNETDKSLFTFTKDRVAELKATDFSAFTALKELNLSVATEEGSVQLLTDAGKVAEELLKDRKTLTKVDFTNFNFSKTTSLKGLFQNDAALTSVIFAGSKATDVVSLESSFAGTAIASTEDVKVLSTSNILSYKGMFEGCTKLATVELDGWNFTKVRTVENMFKGAGAESVTIKRHAKFVWKAELEQSISKEDAEKEENKAYFTEGQKSVKNPTESEAKTLVNVQDAVKDAKSELAKIFLSEVQA